MIYRTAFLTRAKKEEEHDIVLEKQRVKTVAREHAQIHPPYTSDCPICLESRPITNYKSTKVIPCCGGEICFECFVPAVVKSSVNNSYHTNKWTITTDQASISVASGPIQMYIKGFALILRTGCSIGTTPSIHGEHAIVKSSVDRVSTQELVCFYRIPLFLEQIKG